MSSLTIEQIQEINRKEREQGLVPERNPERFLQPIEDIVVIEEDMDAIS